MRKRDGLTARERRQFEELVRIFMEFDTCEPSPHHQHPSQWRGDRDGRDDGVDHLDWSPTDDPDPGPRPGGTWSRWRRSRRARP